MARVWKIGSRWSDNGTNASSIISIFRRNNVVFLGKETKRFCSEVKVGDYIAIADGQTVPAVAKVIGNPMHIDNFEIKILPDEELNIFGKDWKNRTYGVKVKIVDLTSNKALKYKKIGAFCEALQIKNDVINLYENSEKNFSISSYTCILKGDDEKYRKLFFDGLKYIIPVYQRPYSWSENQLEPFIDDIFKGYWGDERNIESQEPIFIGTMQLSEKKYVSEKEQEQDVIDGQQRISTFTVLLKVLSLMYPENESLRSLKFDWLETRVNSGVQNELLNKFLEISTSEMLNIDTLTQNSYIKAARIIWAYLIENQKSENENDVTFDIDSFIDYIFQKIYFVVIETYAGISKTIQIFNTINTTGLDLNGGDLFKVRMYEYLRDKKGYDESAFEAINQIYKEIDGKNIEKGRKVASIISVLDIYKDYLISQYELPAVLFSLGTETFFERLFDTILGIKTWNHFSSVLSQEKQFTLCLEKIKECFNAKIKWSEFEDNSREYMFARRLLWTSRYSQYCRIAYQILLRNGDNAEAQKNVYDALILINKIAFIFSVKFAKSTHSGHSIMQKAIRIAVTKNYDDLISYLKDELGKCRNGTEHYLSGYIVDNAKKKNLICRMSAYFDECDANKSCDEIKALLFETPFDIEHIHANADSSVVVENKLQNSIGNLTMLEQSINRSISANRFVDKKVGYSESKYTSIKKIAEHGSWEKEEIEKRRGDEVNRIIDYLFEGIDVK